MKIHSYILWSACIVSAICIAEDTPFTKAELEAFDDVLFIHLRQPAKEALKSVTRIAREDPATARVYRLARAELLYAQGEIAQAKLDLESLIAEHKRFYPAYYDMACLHALAGQNELALDFMRKGRTVGAKYDESFQEFADPWFGHVLTGDHELAEAELKKRLSRPFDANSPYSRRASRQELADFYLARNRPKDVLELMEQERRLDGLQPLDRQELFLMQGRALLLLDQFDEAFRRFGDALDHAKIQTTSSSVFASLFMLVMIRELGYQRTESLTAYLTQSSYETGYLRLAFDLYEGRGDRRDLETLWQTYAKDAQRSEEATRGGILLALGDIMRANHVAKGIIPSQCIKDALKRLASVPYRRRGFVFLKWQ